MANGTVVRMGTWRLRRDDAATFDQDASYHSKGTCYMDNYRFVQLRDKNSYSGNIVAEIVERRKKDIEKKVPKNLTQNDLTMIFSFFQIISYKLILQQFGVIVDLPKM